jgi:hypothetical protein
MTTPERCPSIGYLTVAGRTVGLVRCELDTGHAVDTPADVEHGVTWAPAIPATPHRAVLEWEDAPVQLADWPEALDASEPFDVDVPIEEPEPAMWPCLSRLDHAPHDFCPGRVSDADAGN